MPIYHSRNLRKGRYSETGNYYILTTVTHRRRAVFADFRAARICINALGFQHDSGRVVSHAFVVMPDHLHLAG